jgi:hypothetical protein
LRTDQARYNLGAVVDDRDELEGRVAELERQIRVQLLLIASVARRMVLPPDGAQEATLVQALHAYADDPSEQHLESALAAAVDGRAGALDH